MCSKEEVSKTLADVSSIPKQDQSQPGIQAKMDPQPLVHHLPSSFGEHVKLEAYRPAGKLQEKVAIVTGGDSGIGRSGFTFFFCYLEYVCF